MQKIIPANASLVPNNAKRVFTGVIFDVYHWQQQMFDGSKETFEMLKRPDTIQVICNKEDKILVLNEEQPHIGKRVNFPCGRIDSTDTSILDAAKRELLEETGLECENWKLVDVEQPYLKTEWFIHTYIATNITSEGVSKLDPGEKITMQWLKLNEVKELIENDKLDIDNSRKIFKQVENIEKLVQIPQFEGSKVDR